MKTITVVGGTGAQGAAVARTLLATNQYRLKILTRSPESSDITSLLPLGNVDAVLNNVEHGYDIAAFEKAARESDGVFINTDGFALGEQAETYWGIRLFETAKKAGVRHILYSGLDDCFSNGEYEDNFYVGHYQGKARVQGYIHGQTSDEKSTWTIIRSGPYMEMLSEGFSPTKDSTGTYNFNIPLEEGAVPFIYLVDFGRYVDWVFSHPSESSGLDLGIATAHVSGRDIAHAFGATTQQPAVYFDIPVSAWSAKAFAALPDGHETKVGYKSGEGATASGQTYRQNFANWFNLYKASAGNKGLIRRDYAQLDAILPDRVSSLKEWMEKTSYSGERLSILKSGRT